ncbi:hypothetical protein [Celeribacter baekdonensis]|uniref:Uncharacterized protein n=1 Tax=Celeribacter baekdonensis B30 TaxID=1208323 RepID=K2KA57_9RHOB|nr:hypothetical protein [Celeribacter baekdonensis]EKE74180.1 hypothetical protein B30_00600 [Celeribacter baekdonensis B30]
MIMLMKTTGQSGTVYGAMSFSWDVQEFEATCRPANHNLTRDARRSNVVLLGGCHETPDFRPDQGARIALVA